MSGDFRDVIVQDCYVDDRIGWSIWIWSVGWSLGGRHGFGGSSGHRVVCMDLVDRMVVWWFAWILLLNVIVFLINDEFKCMTKIYIGSTSLSLFQGVRVRVEGFCFY